MFYYYISDIISMNSIFISQRCAQDFFKLGVDLFLRGYRKDRRNSKGSH